MAWEDKVREEYAEGKAKFYADPRFAGMVGVVVGVVGTLLVQFIF